MKKLYKKLNLFEKLGILAIIVTLIITSVPYFNSLMLNAENDFLAVLKVEDDTADTKKLSVSTNEPSFNKAVLLLNEQEVSRSTIAVDKPAVFYIKSDGVYTVQILDANDQVVETQEKEITGFNSITITPMENSKGFYITSTMKDCDHFIVSFKDQKQEVAVTLVDGTASRGEFTPKENGTYTITCENKDHQTIGTAITYEVTSFEETPQQTPEPVETPDERIHINNEADIKKIDQAPSGNYVLDRDIMISDESSKVLVQKTFTGKLDGNGYQIKGLTQPLFASIKDAEIKNISLLGTLKDKEGALLSLSSQHSSYSHVGIQADIQGEQAVAGMLLQSDQDTITNSYVSGSIQGKNAAGFILKGKASISNSYISGLILAKEQATGFSEQSDISHCYVSANVSGDKTILFNSTDNKLENSFYDINLQEVEDDRATAYTTKELLALTFDEKDSFQQEKDAYPSIKNTNWQELAKASEVLSRMALSLNENIHGITKDINLPKTLNKTDLTWETSGKLKMKRSVLLADVSEDEEKDTSGILKAESKSGVIAYRVASANAIDETKAGESLAETSTHISFNAKEKLYYMVKKKTETVDKPASHKAAIEAGWKRYLWNGVINWNQLEWNTEYVLYEYNLNTKEWKTTEIKTNQGKIGGTITLSDDTAVGSTITATLTDALMTKGTWTWEKSKSLSATTWQSITDKTGVDTDQASSAYTPVSDDAGFYLRATFKATDNLAYTGSTTGVTSKVVTEELTSVSIYNKDGNPVTEADAVVGNMLKAKLDPDKFDSDVTYTWYYEGVSDIQGTGKEYLLAGKDVVGKKVYVKATSKSDGGASGKVTSTSTAEVRQAITNAPTVKPEIVASETTDVSVTVKMPDSVTSGLYQFGYKEGGEENLKSFDLLARGHNAVTITGLKANTTYYIYVKQIGENGYADSDWGAATKDVTTDRQHIIGTVVINGDPIYGETLISSISNGDPDQTTSIQWYRVYSDGTTDEIGDNANNYEIAFSQDIGCKLRVVYKGTGLYAGEISGETEIIKKRTVSAPGTGIIRDQSEVLSDTEIDLQFPNIGNAPGLSKSEKFILGYSTSKNGVPVEYREAKTVRTFERNTLATVSGFKRNTTYYFFLRYAETETHDKSDWSSAGNAVSFTTQKTIFTGNISFAYTTMNKAVQGEKLVAELNDDNTSSDGTWKWVSIGADGTEAPITNFFPEEGKKATYIIIPNDAIVGTTYKVTFTPHEDYQGSAKATSNAVEKYNKEKYIAPTVAPVESKKTDTTLTFQMQSNEAGAVYEFQYSDKADFSNAKDVNIKAYDKTDVTITKLDRNKDYYIRVRRAGDNVKDTSEYSTEYLNMKTEKTDLHGYVSISETPVVNVELTAVYHSASYMPSGNDSAGKWQWYRGDELISGETSSTYTPVTEDIGKKLKAVYTGTGDFQSSQYAISEITKKPIVNDPSVTLDQIADKDNLLTVEGKLSEAGVWYRLQLSSEDEPELPTGYTDIDMTNAKWAKASSTTLTLNKDYNNKNLVPKTSYTLYVVKAETNTTQPSNIMSASKEVGILTQAGSITWSGNTVVGKELTATLDNGNNIYGTWNWYISNTDCGDGSTVAPDISASDQWTQLSSGYYPSVDSQTSTLTISDDMFAKYIKVEFVANESKFYQGTVKSNASSYVKKVYEETLTLSSSTKDGNGNPKAYAGTVITGTVDNYIETGSLKDTRTTVSFKIDTSTTTVISPTDFKVDGENNKATFTYTLPSTSNSTYDGHEITAEISKPKLIGLYVDKDMKPLSKANLNSKTSTATSFPYAYGIPISNADDLLAFMDVSKKNTYKGGLFASDSADYIIVNNINLDGYGAVASANLRGFYKGGKFVNPKFTGTLNGDYHTISNLKNTMLFYIEGTDADPVLLSNMILQNANVDVASVTDKSEYNSAGIIAGNSKGKCGFENIFLVDSVLTATYDCGYILGRADDFDINSTSYYKNCGSVGGKVTSGWTTGGLGGNIGAASVTNCYNIGTVFKGNSNTTSIGAVSSNTTVVTNYYTAGIFDSNGKGLTPFGNVPLSTASKNHFFDTKISTSPLTYKTPSDQQRGLNTIDMIGDKLKPNFGSTGIWRYAEGFYPRLSWMGNNKIATLYAATRGTFTSIDGATTYQELFNGNISGAIQIPIELQTPDYSVSSSNASVLKVIGSTIIPVGTAGQKATITIKYTEPDAAIGGTASNSYEFTIGKQTAALDSITISGKTQPGEKLTANVAPVSSTVKYQWYKRPKGTSNRVKIDGAIASTYTITPSDIGMEINVDVTANGYATSSNYTDVITSVAPKGITTSNTTDVSIDVQANGITDANYEYAYATSDGGKKTIVGQSTSKFTINGLSRNKQYYLYARVAGADDGSYEASAWSPAVPITTEKTKILGDITINANINMGQTLTATMPDTNLQTGDWKVERIDTDGNATADLTSAATINAYSLSYGLTKADAGSRIRISFVANGNFEDPDAGVTNVVTKELLLQSQIPPTAPAREISDSETDHQLQVKETDSEADTQYQFGYRRNTKDEVTVIDGTYNTNDIATITGLDRNTTYYIYARKAKKEDYEPSPWSPAIQITTKKTNISTSTVTFNGNAMVEETVTFTVENADNNVNGQTGIWVLERIGDSGEKNTLIGTTSDDTQMLSYKIVPEDSGYQLKATYIANGDYEGSVETSSPVVVNHSQSIDNFMPTVSDDQVKVYSISASVQQESNDIFEFGYKKQGTSDSIMPYEATATWGNSVEITSLDRDTTYEIYVRKAAKTGYNASEWSTTSVVKTTLKEKLSGNITYEGSTAVNATITAQYEAGTYEYPGDDTTGTWQWYLNGEAVDGANTNKFKIEPMAGNPSVSVKYTANADEGFEGVIERNFGNVFKSEHDVPPAATVSANPEDDEVVGSTLHVNNTEIDNVYIYLRSADNDELPDRVVASTVTEDVKNDPLGNLERWIKAESEMDIRVPANRSYVVYSARLENDTNAASEISSARGVLSAREPLSRKESTQGSIIDENTNIKWKALQEKQLSYSLEGVAPTATWKFYVQASGESTWQNIDQELKALGRRDEISEDKTKAITTFEVPMKYKGYKLKAELTGTDDYSGTVEFITPDTIEGTMINTSAAKITASDNTQLLDKLKAEYTANDDMSGNFVWYRHTTDGTPDVVVQKDAASVTSEYQVVLDDLNNYIYAVYEASPASLYSGTATTDSVFIKSKAVQNQPNRVEKIQVNGNSVQVKAPTNYKTEGMDAIPQVVLGYQETDELGTPKNNTITWQLEGAYGDTWFKRLKKNTYYVFYAKYLGTGVYAPSDTSLASNPVLTENETFDEDSLSLTLVKNTKATTDTDTAIVGDSIHASYKGNGYDEGKFSLQRSNGEEVPESAYTVSTDAATETTTLDYTYTGEDVGSSMIVRYSATTEATHYDGYIEKSSNKIVTKAPAVDTPEQPVLKRGLDTNLFVEVNPSYEYYLSESNTPPTAESGDWDILEVNTTDPEHVGEHEFRNLGRTTKYYLHARVAETENNLPSESITSDPESPSPYVDMGNLTVGNNTTNDNAAMKETASIEFPYTLNKENLNITSMTLIKKGDDTNTEIPCNRAVSTFADANGKATRAVQEKGSTWANQNFACNIQLFNDAGTVVSSTQGNGTTLNAKDAAKMNLQVYRANAVTQGGTYIWQALVKDESGNEALLQSEVTFETDIKAVIPMQISMQLYAGAYLKQNSNTQRINNNAYMPVNILIGKNAEKGALVPDLAGVYTGGDVSWGNAYLKLSNDNSNYTSRWNGVWLTTGGSDNNTVKFTGLGHLAGTNYYATGISNYNWTFDDSHIISNAYKIRFVTQISDTDISLNTQVKEVFKEE